MHTSSANSALRGAFTNPRLLPFFGERLLEKQQHMSDTETSGAPSSAPVATAGTTPSVGSPGTPPIGAFGSTRGSGLARGKRPTPAASTAGASAAPSGYKPSALEVIRPQSEYKNPFTGETSVGAPASPEPAERIINEPAPQAASPETPVASAPVFAAAPAPAPAPATAELFPFNAPGDSDRAPAEKAELKILPPTAETKRPAVSWEAGGPSPADDRRNERPTFRPERRDAKPFEPREGKPFEQRESRDGKPFVPREQREQKPFAPREPRRDGQQRNFEPRSGQPQQPYQGGQGQNRTPRPEEPKKSAGFFGWLKDLFGGKPAETPAAGGRGEGDQRRERDGEFGHDGQRRHRGGRGRGRGGFQGENRGPRDGQPYQPRDPRDEAGSPQPEGDRGYSGGGQGENREGGGRRRRRGGRGRFRGEGGAGGGGGDRGNDPRPEGQQGGGAI